MHGSWMVIIRMKGVTYTVDSRPLSRLCDSKFWYAEKEAFKFKITVPVSRLQDVIYCGDRTNRTKCKAKRRQGGINRSDRSDRGARIFIDKFARVISQRVFASLSPCSSPSEEAPAVVKQNSNGLTYPQTKTEK